MSQKDFRNLYRKYDRMNKSSDELAANPPPENIPPVLLGGKDIPDPATIFTNKLTKHVTPTMVQRHAIPVIMAGRDLMACAPSGSGKTGSFCLPIVHGVMHGTRYQSSERIVLPVALILCKTVQRVKKVFDEVKELCRGTGVKVRSGEELAKHKPQEKAFDVDILVGTPQRILKILDAHSRYAEPVQKAILSLQNVKYLALDEADQLLPKLYIDILRIIKHTDMPSNSSRQTIFPSDRQTLFFGVALSSEVQRLASEFLKEDYIFFCEGDYRSGKFCCEDIRTEDKNSSEIYAYRQRSAISECDEKLGNDAVDWED